MSQPPTREKRPRHYAAEIIALPKAQREAALAQVPMHLRAWVRDLVADHDLRIRAQERRAYP